MSESAVFKPYPEAPARIRRGPLTAAPSGAWEGVHAERFVTVSRGDFVPGVLYLPESEATQPCPLILVQHGSGGSKDAPELDFAARWVRDGAAVAAIDLPLHGERISPKLSERLVDGIARSRSGADLDQNTQLLVDEFARQSTSDLVRTLDALSDLSEVDEKRIGFLGLGLGGVVGSYWLAHDDRVDAAVLALTGGGLGPREHDPARWLPEVSSTAILVVAADKDANTPAAASQALFDSAPEPREIATFPGDHTALPSAAVEKIGAFYRENLGL